MTQTEEGLKTHLSDPQQNPNGVCHKSSIPHDSRYCYMYHREEEDEQEVYDRDERYKLLPKHLQDHLLTLDELNSKPIPEVRWIVDNLLTEGFTILAGYLKSGKSILALNIGIAIAEGRPVLGETRVEQGRVLLITPDDKMEARLRARIRKMRLGREESIPLDIFTEWANLDEGGIEDIRSYLDIFPETKLVIIDVLMNVLPGIKEGADAYDELYRKLPPLKELAQKRHVAIVAIMHTSKKDGQKGSNPRSAIYGSQAYGAIADNLLIIEENYDTHQRSFMTYGKDMEEKKFPLEYAANTGIYTYGKERREELQTLTAIQTVEAYVAASPGMYSYKQIVQWLMSEQGIKQGSAEQRVTRAGKEGKICTQNGVYYPCLNTPSQETDDSDTDED